MALKQAALKIRENAYAPYSGFQVGVALRSSSGEVYTGVNVENAAYPEGTCAEAGAIARMIAAGDRKITAVYVVADGAEPVPPCGGCRQKLAEFSAPDVPVTMATISGIEKTLTVAQLLPGAFTPEHMDHLG
ncbi:cytidine deaminase [Paracoccaceae bacterium]|jgi:cytidine deaminase|nr:cytidine deaminase [Marinovum sp.]MBT3650746.1 cytidine deaminase [Paracoccaceae bacterium]MED7677988.1 cytidine deaminase [Rhodobacteraceae bacterium IMCC15231]OAH06988.1 Cytidine deaminase [Rhodobacteraceae bacterium SB2]WQC63273.1 cytidine deaminase [Alphaproteobacteria bacterium US3C007]|tara:strand:- start:86 stop:481 length:396 start_codon:yes stop_codon:yes gene_type:complete